MRPVLRLLRDALLLSLRIAALVLALAVMLPLALLAAINTAPGRTALADLITRVSGNTLRVSGLAGALPWHPRAARIALRGADGKDWLVLSDVAADIDPAALLDRRLTLTRLVIGKASVRSQPPAGKGGTSAPLPVAIRVKALSIPVLHLDPAVAIRPLDLAVTGQVALTRGYAPSGALHVTAGKAALPGGLGVAGAAADLRLDRAGALHLALRVAGAAASSWQAPGPIALTLATHLADPLAALTLRLDGPQTALTGSAGYADGKAHVALAGALGAAPLTLDLAAAQAGGGGAGGGDAGGGWAVQQARFAWRGITLAGTARIPAAAPPRIDAAMRLADLRDIAPVLAALGQSAIAIPQGTLEVTAKGSTDALAVTLAGRAVLAGGPAQLSAAALVNGSARSLSLDRLAASWRGANLRIAAPASLSMTALRIPALDLAMKGARARLAATGRIAPTLDLNVDLAAMPLATLAQFGGPALTGTLNAGARITGTPAAPTAALHFAAAGVAPAHLAAGALPPARLA
ncbi:MAG: hypothetical protein KGL12_07960, partial [Rhodospirillales bacterium]|nr:hypothetical protein [Rhodospirillales bacterium]